MNAREVKWKNTYLNNDMWTSARCENSSWQTVNTVTRLVDKMSVLTLRHLLPAILVPSAEPPLAWYVIGVVLLVSMRSLLED